MKKKVYKLNVELVVDRIINYTHSCDGDELARLCGELFGGECMTKEGATYIFKPNEYYSGEFNDVK
jgi:fructosamine-3-kinase